MSGVKHDIEKAPMALLPPRALEQVAKAMGYGAQKYGMYNYLKGIGYSRMLSALLRHTFQYLKGEDCDVESGLPHWAHIGANVLMLGEMTFERPEMDDRHKSKCGCEDVIPKDGGAYVYCGKCKKVRKAWAQPKCNHEGANSGALVNICVKCGEKI